MATAPQLAPTVVPSIAAHITGDNSGQIAVGDHILQLTNYGGLVNVAPPAQTAQVTRRSQPVKLLPRPFPHLIGRQQAQQLALQHLSIHQSVDVYGQPGIGKSVLVRHLLHSTTWKAYGDGIVYVSAHGKPRADLEQFLFEAFYDTDIPYRATDHELAHYLQPIQALVVLDDLQLDAAAIEQLLNRMPQCLFLVTAPERRLGGDGRPLPLSGLPLPEAVALLQQDLGRPLRPAEYAHAEALCQHLEGHPLRILQASALHRQERRSLAKLAQQAAKTRDRVLLSASSTRKRQQQLILAILTALEALAMTVEQLARLSSPVISSLPETRQVLQSLEQLRLVQLEGNAYSLAPNLAEGLAQRWPIEQSRQVLLERYVTWVGQLPSEAIPPEDIDPMQYLAAWAVDQGHYQEAIILARAIEPQLMRSHRWGAWFLLLGILLQAARALADTAQTAWALHQLGTRALCLGDRDTALSALTEALELRQSLGNADAIAVTRHNLELLLGPNADSDEKDADPIEEDIDVDPSPAEDFLDSDPDDLSQSLAALRCQPMPSSPAPPQRWSLLTGKNLPLLLLAGGTTTALAVMAAEAIKNLGPESTPFEDSPSLDPNEIEDQLADISIQPFASPETESSGSGPSFSPSPQPPSPPVRPSHPPQALPDIVTTAYGQAVQIVPLQNDRDRDGNPLAIVALQQPLQGRVQVHGDGSLTYTPAPRFSGSERFEYTVSDGDHTAKGLVEVAVAAPEPIQAFDDFVQTAYGQPVRITPLHNDRDPRGQALQITEVTAPAHGRVERQSDGSLLYRPATQFSGQDGFIYTVSDGDRRAAAAVQIEVLPTVPLQLNHDFVETPQEQPVEIAPLANDRDPLGQPLRLEEVATPAHGRLERLGSNRLRYTPDPGFSGLDTFEYGASNGEQRQQALIEVSVVAAPLEAVNDAVDTAYREAVEIRPLDNDRGDTLRLDTVTPPDHGQLAIDEAAGTITYTPEPDFSGRDRITYTLTDGSQTDTATIAITVLPPPEIQVTDDQITTEVGQAVTLFPLDNDRDPAGEPLELLSVSAPEHGSVTRNDDGSVTYLSEQFVGADRFTYQVQAGHRTATATVAVTVTEPPSEPVTAPLAVAQPAEIDFGSVPYEALVGNGRQQELTIRNQGDAPLQIESLTITSNDPNSPLTVPLQGTMQLPQDTQSPPDPGSTGSSGRGSGSTNGAGGSEGAPSSNGNGAGGGDLI
ncbi:hypothetical protein XM38_044610 [Halomicronema hongdechloris C2206]|uniref:Uncharacterized protein n=1 Tax=Halomicronema hongdechloris C2206 TaxID=1641165 RepID=A0A1Z3HT70_9CYAN|nr:Ig-like domain-containing protein [Halomicronema hongdechloris]ASC73494.1 hypothetical protein XM38_044610 [Halomicronema hongdechloris C2206]